MFYACLQIGRPMSRLEVVNNLTCLNIELCYNLVLGHCVLLICIVLYYARDFWILLWFVLASWFPSVVLHRKTIKEMGFPTLSRLSQPILDAIFQAVTMVVEKHTYGRGKGKKDLNLLHFLLVPLPLPLSTPHVLLR